ncbi:hypothetical protein [Okeania sp. SIO2B3]|uniref:hypothetical protein n=1 Tax=Okeania sp. SIO2B3 TaxID=2607784 RepID=UPI0025FB7C6A|nr:hypothetical protein [Okeania sp. SIO2B3]
MSKNQESSREKKLAYYCQLFTEINTSKSQKLGTAKHKPILLLSVIDLIAQGLIQKNEINVSKKLVDTFNQYWDLLSSDSHRRGLYYPFYHLQSDNFWHINFNSDFINTLPEKTVTKEDRPKSLTKLRKIVNYASFDA